MRKTKKSILFLVLICGLFILHLCINTYVFQPEEPVIVGFFLGDVEETY